MPGTRSQLRRLRKLVCAGRRGAHFGESTPDTDERKIDPLMAKRRKPIPPPAIT